MNHPEKPLPAFPSLESRALVRDLPASLIRSVANRAMGRKDVIPFWFGESDRATPALIRDAAVESLRQGETFYTENLGRPYLREAIAGYLTSLHGRTFVPGRVVVTASGTSALMLCAQMLVEPGDRVVVVTPVWPNLTEIPRILGAKVVRVGLVADRERWRLDLGRLIEALTPDTRMMIVNSPNNPTGWTMDEREIGIVLEHCRRLGIWILTDEVYERLVYDPARKSAPSFLPHCDARDKVISANSFSKAWSMTGWRIGWIYAPDPVVGDLCKLVEYNTSCVATFTQRAATVAITQGEESVSQLREQLRSSHSRLIQGLRQLSGVDVPDAQGGMYVFLRLDGYDDCVGLARRLIDEVGLGLAPGAAFGPEGRGWLRWCHAVAEERLEAGIERLARFLEGSRQRPA